MKIRNLLSVSLIASSLWAQDATGVAPLELPLPGGQVMRFIPVAVTDDSNLFSVRTFNIGSVMNVNEPITEVRVSGTVYDPSTSTWYIPFCETEVTNAQYAAVMGTAAPAKGTENLPKVNISTSDIGIFMSRLSALMLQNKEFMATMARYNNNKTTDFYFRLPTAVEWEFAARGGSAVDASAFDADFPYPDGKIASYEVLFDGNPRNKKVRAVKGKRLANPVGLYDMLGNVSEVTGPLHYFDCRLGRTGGIPVCGANFNTPKNQARASYRIECSPFNEKGEEYHSNYVGFRPVMGSTIRHKKMSLQIFEQEWNNHVQNVPALTGKPSDSSSEQVQALLIQQLEEKVKEKEKALLETGNRVKELEGVVKELSKVSDGAQVPESEKIKKERDLLRKQLAAAKTNQKEIDALRKRVDVAEKKTQEAVALVRKTEIDRVQAGITILTTSASELSYFTVRLASRQNLLESEEDAEFKGKLKQAISVCEANIASAERYLRKGCELLADTPQEVVEAELAKQFKELKKNSEDRHLYVCLMHAVEYYREYRKNMKHHSTHSLKEKLKEEAQKQ